MDNFTLRIGCINLNEILNIMKEMSISTISNAIEMNENLSPKELIFYVLEELDTNDIKRKNQALLKLLKSFVVKTNTNFLLEHNLDQCFSKGILELSLKMNLLYELSKNLAFLFTKFTEISKEALTIRRLKYLFFIKLNLILVFLIIFFNSSNPDLKNYIKNFGDDLEDNLLKFLKLSTTVKYIPNTLCLLNLFSYVKILLSEYNNEEPATCRKIEKKDKYLTKQNCDLYLLRETPKILYKYEKDNNFIEKFYVSLN